MIEDMLNELAKAVFSENAANGFHEERHELGTYLALITSELSEALEADRYDRWADLESYDAERRSDLAIDADAFRAHIKDTVEDELADALIRILDLCGVLGIDITRHVALKRQYNKTRGYRHGKCY